MNSQVRYFNALTLRNHNSNLVSKTPQTSNQAMSIGSNSTTKSSELLGKKKDTYQFLPIKPA
ncbi:MAG: hypothetical protein U9N19_07680 [Thermodesulfobacteriota bacterium]|nr:hypothetical protein [Thermodesulfobacteriota bacterium]